MGNVVDVAVGVVGVVVSIVVAIPGSDIDLAVEGIPSNLFIRAAADLMMSMDWPIDLKPLEELEDLLRDIIIKKGELIYAA